MLINRRRHLAMPVVLLAAVCCTEIAQAQLTDLTQTPNQEGAGIVKSLEQQIGAGVGNSTTPGFIDLHHAARSRARHSARPPAVSKKIHGRAGIGPPAQDGIGNIHAVPAIGAGLIDSCAGCHGRPRGSAGFGGDVVTKPDSRDAPHLFGLGLQEMLADEITGELRDQRQNAINEAGARNQTITRTLSSKGINYGSIRAMPNGTVDTNGVVGVNKDLRVQAILRARRHDFDSRVRGRRVQRRDGPAGGGSPDHPGRGGRTGGDAHRHGAQRRHRPRQARQGQERDRRSGPRWQVQRDPDLAGRLHGVLSIQLFQARRISTHEHRADRPEPAGVRWGARRATFRTS